MAADDKFGKIDLSNLAVLTPGWHEIAGRCEKLLSFQIAIKNWLTEANFKAYMLATDPKSKDRNPIQSI